LCQQSPQEADSGLSADSNVEYDQEIIPQGRNDTEHHHSTIVDYGGRGHNEGEPGFSGGLGAKHIRPRFIEKAKDAMI
jgi:hypothetical protein